MLRYLWAAPASALGLVLAAAACGLGATARLERGVLEVAGGRIATLLAAAPRRGSDSTPSLSAMWCSA